VDPHLQQLILDRLTADDKIDDPVADLVLAACEGRDALERAIGGQAPERPESSSADGAGPVPPGAYVKSITVEGFRGIGPPATLELSSGPGLTLVVGRNGSGKSSFAEGLETLLTGANLRWESRTKVWREGWQNLHHAGPTTLSAELYVDGQPGLLHVARTWPPGSDVKAANDCTVTVGDVRAMTLAELGWDVALSRYRPFLSYAELGAMFDELATMYDALAAILGLEEVEDLAGALRAARLERERAFKDFKLERDALLDRLDSCEDERAAAAATALQGRTPDFATLELALEGLIAGADPERELERLRQLARLFPPDAERVEEAIAGLEDSAARLEAMEGTDAARDAGVADLLDAAVRHREQHDDPDCPVCGTRNVLDAAWLTHAIDEVKQRRASARDYETARDAASEARRTLGALAGALDAEAVAGLGSELEIDPGNILRARAGWPSDARTAVTSPLCVALTQR